MPAKRTTASRKSVAKKAPAKRASSSKRVTIRTYRHGLGDCHLLSFAKPGGGRCHVLIDCGVVNRTKDPVPLMTEVARDVASVSGGVLDVVIATHQHTDHLSGFKQAEAVFDPARLTMKRLWMAWTEDPENDLGRKIQKDLVKKLTAVRLAAERLRGVADATADRIQGTLDFFSPGVAGEDTQEILDLLQGRPDVECEYHSPGDLLALPGVPNVRVYVLGPPTDPKALKVTNPRKTKHEGYEEAQLAADADGFVAALAGDEDPADLERCFPFDARYRHDESTMRDDPFFRRHYFGEDEAYADAMAKRTIDASWLQSAEQLALALGDYTNNTSLALAFEFIDTGDVLLFPGDAQIGSWNTWPDLEWQVRDAGATRTVRIGDLLARTVFYKASHHASHNGTLSGLAEGAFGLEQMTHRDLVCVVPVDLEMSKAMNWDRTLPWQPLLDRLERITRGRLILTDGLITPPKASALERLSAAERKRFASAVKVQKTHVEYTR
jgi:hypothetical protein